MKRTPTKPVNRSPLRQHFGSDPTLNLDTDNADSDGPANVTRRVKRKIDPLPSSLRPENSNPNLEEIKSLILESNRQQDAKFNSLNAAMTSVMSQNAEIHKSIEFMSQKYDDLLSKMNTLQHENNEYKSRITTLESKLEHLERNSKASCVENVEIRNVPKSETEKKDTLLNLVKNVGSALQENIQDSDIRDIYRIKTKESTVGSIVVEFTTIGKKDNLIKACRTYNKNYKDQPFSTAQINYSGPCKPIYIAESLTKKAQHLHYLARQFKRTHKYHGCWTSYGKIYLRKEERSPAILIDSEADLKKLK